MWVGKMNMCIVWLFTFNTITHILGCENCHRSVTSGSRRKLMPLCCTVLLLIETSANVRRYKERVRDEDIGYNIQIDNTLIVLVNNDNTIIVFYFHFRCEYVFYSRIAIVSAHPSDGNVQTNSINDIRTHSHTSIDTLYLYAHRTRARTVYNCRIWYRLKYYTKTSTKTNYFLWKYDSTFLSQRRSNTLNSVPSFVDDVVQKSIRTRTIFHSTGKAPGIIYNYQWHARQIVGVGSFF